MLNASTDRPHEEKTQTNILKDSYASVNSQRVLDCSEYFFWVN